ncbi:hydroxyacid dehydrogenase [Mesorhizobium sp. M1A.F.Ca.IN.020.06.1.1]|uniref:hydroxyacid dehydrogenase n=1 Tax=unclassified Mesorhizobium TaxID=325217 RepID=UPI000BB078C0|nr:MULTISPECIES: hydroxyacid dehydrogenase [unclassified Mesorhizobium]PBB31871.1 hydroxyacid dehydrogenase [Mesorhizobium sp. WSM3882]PBB40913.1 hydroxyacid dehydrogenase [Mesorhizobium sp. WSM3866]RUU96391.1 hydroxyacid dehydrogenase [Mesorhizobium sp. M1A.F.Ca.IN.020.03.2.1]RUV89743.1 hydroxyacid dehydrogenase [Mesorhizobium sp. M1A.F.Ca.IN.020.32.1.1]RUW10669.1 hydroxyacid dehydrogenase [Mesorhizobium sp. M1A.F.Ca.IN.022.05.2.1]
MSNKASPLVISAPEPRTLDLIFTPPQLALFRKKYRIVETTPEGVSELPTDVLAEARYIVGQPPITPQTLERLKALRCIFNVETNLINNMPYETLFARGIHVVTTGLVFAEPVAELGLAMALNLARGIVDADLAFRQGEELWGGDGNQTARLLSGSDVGIIGFGDLGRALNRLLTGFRTRTRVFDPWLPPSVLVEHGVEPASLDKVLSESDFVFVVASVTSENQGFLGADAFAKMRQGAAFILLSRAGVVDFPALMGAVKSGHIVAASDVFPEEPLAKNHPVRSLSGFLRSAHRAGALDVAFKRMGDMVLEDMDLLDRGLPPMRSKRAERETVSRMRSKPVDRN